MGNYCVRTGKHSHDTRDKAEAHLKSIRRSKSYSSGRIYFCKFCSGFHVGRTHKAKKKKGMTSKVQNKRCRH